MHRGRTWDFFPIMLNNTNIKCHLDTTWGLYCYMEILSNWFKFSLFEMEDIIGNLWIDSDKKFKTK